MQAIVNLTTVYAGNQLEFVGNVEFGNFTASCTFKSTSMLVNC